MKKKIRFILLCLVTEIFLTACSISPEDVDSLKKEFGIDAFQESLSDISNTLSGFKDTVDAVQSMEEEGYSADEIERMLEEKAND